MLNWFSRKTPEQELLSRLSGKKTVRIGGIKFVIQKLSPLNYADGSNALLQVYDEYQVNKSIAPSSEKKLKAHFIDVFTAAVVSPKLTRKEDDGSGVYVERLFCDWGICERLYHEIMALSYGKKKLKLPT